LHEFLFNVCFLATLQDIYAITNILLISLYFNEFIYVILFIYVIFIYE